MVKLSKKAFTHKLYDGMQEVLGFCDQLLLGFFLGLFWDCFRGCVDINDSLEAKEFCDEK